MKKRALACVRLKREATAASVRCSYAGGTMWRSGRTQHSWYSSAGGLHSRPGVTDLRENGCCPSGRASNAPRGSVLLPLDKSAILRASMPSAILSVRSVSVVVSGKCAISEPFAMS